MTDIFVQRGSGDRRGEDVVDPLLATIPVAIRRGKAELDEQSSGLQDVNIETVYRTGVRLGQLGGFGDNFTGVIWRGKIVGISHHFDGLELSTTLQVKKPTVFTL